MIQLIEMLDVFVVLGIIWAIINIAHAIMTMGQDSVGKGFFWSSNKIKQNIKGKDNGGTKK